MSYIDQDATAKALLAMEKNASERGKSVIQMCITKVLGMFPADVAPVVYCKNCKFGQSDAYWGGFNCVVWNGAQMKANDYCSCGERRNDDG